MKSRAVFIIIGLMLVASGSMGIVLYDREHTKQQEENQARVAEEQQRVQAEQKKAQDLSAQLEAEKQRALDAEQKLKAADEARRKQEEINRKKQEEERLAKKKKEGEDRLKQAAQQKPNRRGAAPMQNAKAARSKKVEKVSGRAPLPPLSPKQDKYMSGFEDRERAKEKREKTTYIRFELDPSRGREIRVARLHAGDRVSIKVRRMVGADQSLYVGLAPMAGSEFGRGGAPLVATPIKDRDHLTIAPEASFGSDMMRAIDSRDGVVLNVGVGRPSGYREERESYGRGGFFLVELSIYSDNRWNIKPRSLL